MTISAIPILFENPNLLAVDKPEGIPSIHSRGKTSLQSMLEAGFSQKLYAVHRLDKEVSGVILFARNAEAHKYLNEQFDRREVRKTYVAQVHGVIKEARGTINKPLREFGSGRMGLMRSGESPASPGSR